MTGQYLEIGTVVSFMGGEYSGFCIVEYHTYLVAAYIPWEEPLVKIGETYTLTKIGQTYALGQKILSE